MNASLVYHAGALGDFITTLPAMAAWRRLHPAERIVLFGKSLHAELAPQGLFDEVWESGNAEFAPMFGVGLDAGSEPATRFAAFQSALLFSSSSSQLPANLANLGVGGIVRQDPLPGERVPIIDYHLSLFPGLSLAEKDRQPIVRRTPGLLAVPANTVALHPGSGDRRKNWPVARFQELAALLEEAGSVVRWIIGPAEETSALPRGAQVWRNSHLSSLAAALSECRLFVGNDSGITHLAAAAGCPTVAL
ncbi:MAG TPA: glycosyltransferase family 9 protein, partial [Spirochaetia bacterium]|nr:glycosyltransferase family 9 protein [Spirochaetia bacterium]